MAAKGAFENLLSSKLAAAIAHIPSFLASGIVTPNILATCGN